MLHNIYGSVHASQVTEMPSWGHVIREVECANHAVECYRGTLEQLVAEKQGEGRAHSSHEKMFNHLCLMCHKKVKCTSGDRKQAAELGYSCLR